jgi:hypothetical protein
MEGDTKGDAEDPIDLVAEVSLFNRAPVLVRDPVVWVDRVCDLLPLLLFLLNNGTGGPLPSLHPDISRSSLSCDLLDVLLGRRDEEDELDETIDAVEPIDSSVGQRGRDPRIGGNGGAKPEPPFILLWLLMLLLELVFLVGKVVPLVEIDRTADPV